MRTAVIVTMYECGTAGIRRQSDLEAGTIEMLPLLSSHLGHLYSYSSYLMALSQALGLTLHSYRVRAKYF